MVHSVAAIFLRHFAMCRCLAATFLRWRSDIHAHVSRLQRIPALVYQRSPASSTSGALEQRP